MTAIDIKISDLIILRGSADKLISNLLLCADRYWDHAESEQKPVSVKLENTKGLHERSSPKDFIYSVPSSFTYPKKAKTEVLKRGVATRAVPISLFAIIPITRLADD